MSEPTFFQRQNPSRPLTVGDMQKARLTPTHQTCVASVQAPNDGPRFVILIEKPSYDLDGRAYVYDATEARRLAAELLAEADAL